MNDETVISHETGTDSETDDTGREYVRAICTCGWFGFLWSKGTGVDTKAEVRSEARKHIRDVWYPV